MKPQLSSFKSDSQLYKKMDDWFIPINKWPQNWSVDKQSIRQFHKTFIFMLIFLLQKFLFFFSLLVHGILIMIFLNTVIYIIFIYYSSLLN